MSAPTLTELFTVNTTIKGPQQIWSKGSGANPFIFNNDTVNTLYVGTKADVNRQDISSCIPFFPLAGQVWPDVEIWAFAPVAVNMLITPGGSQIALSPVQIQLALNAAGLMKDTTGQAIHSTLGVPAQSHDVTTSLPVNLQATGVPPFVPGIKAVSAVQLNPPGSPTTLITFTQDGTIWYAGLNLAVASNAAYAATDGPFSYMYLTNPANILLSCQCAINGPGQAQTSDQNISFGGIAVKAGDTIVVNINNGNTIANAFIRASATILYTLGAVGGGGGTVSSGALDFLLPSGDVTGVTDANNVMNSYNSGHQVFLTPGVYYWKQGIIVIPTAGFYIYGAGEDVTIVNGVGTGTVVRMYSSLSYTSGWGGGFLGWTMDCNGMGAGSVGVHVGDIYRLKFGFGVRNLPGDKGVWIDNNYQFAEQISGDIWIERTNIQFDHSADISGVSTGSYDRAKLTLWLDGKGTGNLVTFANGAFMENFELGIYGNTDYGTVLHDVLTLTGNDAHNYSLLAKGTLNIGVECNATVGVQPRTINFASAQNNTILDCTGIIDFSGNNPFAHANNFQGSFSFDGPVYGDTVLQSSGPLGGYPFKFGVLNNGDQLPTRYSGLIEATPAANVTGVKLQGFIPDDWRVIEVLNNGTGSITFDVPGVSHVANGTACVIQPNSSRRFRWVNDGTGSGLWYPDSP
jgi:hypothetical protein